MTKRPKHLFEFGPFRMDTVECLLLRNGEVVPLSPKLFEILQVLVENSGHLLEKDEFIKEVWPDAFVEEGSLTRNISALRAVLGESENGNQYIETVPKRGYRFVGRVREVVDDGVELIAQEDAKSHIVIERDQGTRTKIKSNRRAAATLGLVTLVISVAAVVYFTKGGETIDSVAVLPLMNVSADPKLEYLSEGISDSIINNLSQLPTLKVIALSSVLRYKGQQADPHLVGRELNVRAILTGRLIQRGDGLAISVELVDARDNRRLWADSITSNSLISSRSRHRLRVRFLRSCSRD